MTGGRLKSPTLAVLKALNSFTKLLTLGHDSQNGNLTAFASFFEPTLKANFRVSKIYVC